MAIANTIQSITPSLFAWQAYEPEVKCDLSSCAIETDEGLIIVDPIDLSPTAFEMLIAGRKPGAIILTNGNHARAAEKFRTRLHVKVFAALDADGLDLIPDAWLINGQIAPGGMQVITLPGSGPGEIALVGRGIACIGDAVIHLPPEGLRLLPDKYCADAALNRESLRKLLSCDFRVMTFAHGAPLVESAHTRLEELLA